MTSPPDIVNLAIKHIASMLKHIPKEIEFLNKLLFNLDIKDKKNIDEFLGILLQDGVNDLSCSLDVAEKIIDEYLIEFYKFEDNLNILNYTSQNYDDLLNALDTLQNENEKIYDNLEVLSILATRFKNKKVNKHANKLRKTAIKRANGYRDLFERALVIFTSLESSLILFIETKNV